MTRSKFFIYFINAYELIYLKKLPSLTKAALTSSRTLISSKQEISRSANTESIWLYFSFSCTVSHD